MERRACFVVLVLLPWLCASKLIVNDVNIEEELKKLSQEEIAAQVSGLLSRPGSAVAADDLPAARPPVYWMCDYTCMNKADIASDKGVFTLDMT